MHKLQLRTESPSYTNLWATPQAVEIRLSAARRIAGKLTLNCSAG